MTEHPKGLSFRVQNIPGRAGIAWLSLISGHSNPIAAIIDLRQSLDEKTYLELMTRWQQQVQGD